LHQILEAFGLDGSPPKSSEWYAQTMQFTVELPDELVERLVPEGSDPARLALEDMAVEAYRTHRLTEHEVATLLGLDRYELDGFLKRREVWLEYSIQDLQRDLETHRRLGL
jgi:predicted HTH domain antitoxin